MSRSTLILVVVLVLVAGIVAFLHSEAREVPQTRVEKQVAPEALGH